MTFDVSNKAFIEALVQEPVESFFLSEGSQAGDNVAGDLKSIAVKTRTSNLHLIHKTFPANPIEKDRVRNYRIFRVENQFYGSLRPDIEELTNAIGYKMPTAKYYAGMNDDENDYITLEDLRPDGYKMHDKFQGLGFPEVSAIMEMLGKFHAAGYYFLRQKGEDYFESRYSLFGSNSYFLKEHRHTKPVFLQGIYQSTCNLISAEAPELGRVVSKYYASPPSIFGPLANAIMDLTDSKIFPTIVHGDLWVNNILIKEASENRKLQVKLVDFQMTRRGNIFEDLVYFMFTSTTPKFRRSHLTEALSIYFETFAGFLREIKSELPVGFTLGSLLDGFRALTVPGFIYMTFAIPMQLGIPLKVLEVQEIQNKVLAEDGIQVGKAPGFTLEQRTRFLKEKLSKETKASPLAMKRLLEMAEEARPFF